MITYETNYLAHHGILGMKWGVRRYQNKDGSLTAAGRKRLEKKDAKFKKKDPNTYNKLAKQKQEVMRSQKRMLDEANKTLDLINNPSKEKFEKQAKKEIEFEKDLLKETYYSKYEGGIKNPTDQDALDHLFWEMGKNKSKATFDNLVKEISNQHVNNSLLKKHEEEYIKKTNDLIDTLGNLTVYELNEMIKSEKKNHFWTPDVWTLLNEGKFEEKRK